jgi:ThiF family protein
VSDDTLRLSRIAKTVARLGNESEDSRRFPQKPVLLTGEATVLTTVNGRETLLFALRLLVRVSRRVDVVLPPQCAELAETARALAEAIGLGGNVTTPGTEAIAYERYAAILSVGTSARPELPWTVINSNGWLARVSSGAKSISGMCSQHNPIGARVAANLGVAEVFKRTAAVKPDRGALLDGLRFSAFTYTCGSEDTGPPLPDDLVLPTFLLGGCGAIGNGVTELLAALRARGAGVTIDKQCFGAENLGTCVLMRATDIGVSKAESMAATLRAAGLDVIGVTGTIADVAPRLGKDLLYPTAVLGGLDKVEPRHELQRLWPDVYIDGATSDLACQVTRHPWAEQIGCAICVFELPMVSSDAVALRLTGLRPERLHDPDALVDQNDVDAAKTPEQRAWLVAHLGQRICSVLPAAVLAAISTEDHPENFEPSVPFVACLAAAFVVGELVKVALGMTSTLAPRFQMDVLQGPERGELYAEDRSATCECVNRAKNIERVRASRADVGRLEAPEPPIS